MNPNFIILIFLFFALYLSECKLKIDSPTWLKHMTRYTVRNLHVHQVVFLIDDDIVNGFPMLDIVTRQLERRSPVISFTFEQMNVNKFQDSKFLQLLENPRTTTFFVVLSSSKGGSSFPDLVNPINFIIETSTPNIRPKCLFLFLSSNAKSSNFEELLLKMWQKQFLDVTVLEVVNDESKNQNQFSNTHRTIDTVHFFNPFNNSYTVQIYTSQIEWFPNKLQNLHGFGLKVGLFNRPPTAYVTKNSSFYPIEASGIDVKLANTLSEKMNFSIIPLQTRDGNFGNFNCNPAHSEGFLKKVFFNEIQFIVAHGVGVRICANKVPVEYTVLGLEKFNILVPIIEKETVVLVGKWEFFLTTMLIVLMTTSIWIISHLLKLQSRCWRFLEIIGLTLQVAIPDQPRNFKERILFIGIVASGIMYASEIYAGLAAFQFKTDLQEQINTLEDFYQAGLKLLAHPNVATIITEDTQGVLQEVVNNSIRTVDMITDCYSRMQEKDTACLIRSIEAEHLIQMSKNENCVSRVKIIEESVWVSLRVMFLESSSPYTERFNDIAEKFFEFDLGFKWTETRTSKSRMKWSNKEITARKDIIPKSTLSVLLLIILVGYAGSIMIFVGEIVVAHVLKASGHHQ